MSLDFLVNSYAEDVESERSEGEGSPICRRRRSSCSSDRSQSLEDLMMTLNCAKSNEKNGRRKGNRPRSEEEFDPSALVSVKLENLEEDESRMGQGVQIEEVQIEEVGVGLPENGNNIEEEDNIDIPEMGCPSLDLCSVIQEYNHNQEMGGGGEEPEPLPPVLTPEKDVASMAMPPPSSLKCIICKRTFLHKYKLDIHMRLHTGERPFKCPEAKCDKAFIHSSYLQQHIVREHSGHKLNHGQNSPSAQTTATNCTETRLRRKQTGQGIISKVSAVAGPASKTGRRMLTANVAQPGQSPAQTKEDLKCRVCLKVFLSSYKLMIHMRLHTGERPHKCSMCSKAFIHQSYLQHHIMRFHQGSVSSASTPRSPVTINKSWKTETHRHSINSAKQKDNHLHLTAGSNNENDDSGMHPILTLPKDHPFICPFCFICFRENLSLIEHLKSHIEGKFVFPNSSFPKQNGVVPMQNTSKTNGIVKAPSSPDICGEPLVSPPVPEKPAVTLSKRQCSICRKRFPHPAKLIIHMRCHTGEKPFRCTFCNNRFRQSIHLRRHIETMHKDVDPNSVEIPPETSTKSLFDDVLQRPCVVRLVRCDSSDFSWSRDSTPAPHQNGYGNADVKEESSDANTSGNSEEFIDELINPNKRSNLVNGNTSKSPVRTRLHKCSMCPLSFNSLYQLKLHIQSHTRPWKCPYCKKDFTRKEYRDNHVQNLHLNVTKSYVCDFCNKAFKYKESLRQHLVVHSTGKKGLECDNCHARFTYMGTLRKHMKYRCPAAAAFRE